MRRVEHESRDPRAPDTTEKDLGSSLSRFIIIHGHK